MSAELDHRLGLPSDAWISTRARYWSRSAGPRFPEKARVGTPQNPRNHLTLTGMPRDWGALPGWLLRQSAPAVANAANSGPNRPALALFAATAVLGMVLLALGLALVRWLGGRGR